jgi:hypothetical protein
MHREEQGERIVNAGISIDDDSKRTFRRSTGFLVCPSCARTQSVKSASAHYCGRRCHKLAAIHTHELDPVTIRTGFANLEP